LGSHARLPEGLRRSCLPDQPTMKTPLSPVMGNRVSGASALPCNLLVKIFKAA